jgi:hypothetical protein
LIGDWGLAAYRSFLRRVEWRDIAVRREAAAEVDDIDGEFARAIPKLLRRHAVASCSRHAQVSSAVSEALTGGQSTIYQFRNSNHPMPQSQNLQQFPDSTIAQFSIRLSALDTVTSNLPA